MGLQFGQKLGGLVNCEDDCGDFSVTHLIGGLAMVLSLAGQVGRGDVVLGPCGEYSGLLGGVLLVSPPPVLGHRPAGGA